jgi:hypothetical protein
MPLRAGVGGGRPLSAGALVQGSVRARLLDLPLVRLDPTIVLLPVTNAASRGGVAAGDGLVEAVPSISDGAEVLAQVGLNGRS